MPSHPLETQLENLANPESAEKSKRFHKTEKANKGEEIHYLGIRMKPLREVAKKNKTLPLNEVPELLSSRFHESRLLALLILVQKFTSADDAEKTKIYNVYLTHTAYLTSWDLVDVSAYFIVGPYLEDKSRAPLYKLASSKSLWERRIAMLSTLHFIRKNDFEDALKLAELLLPDEEDLIHKVVGWMLKEVGNRDRNLENTFLRKQYKEMHRTTLRYAIEKFSKEERKAYLDGTL